MRPERREQGYWEIGIEMKVLSQFGKTEIFSADISAAESKGRFAPMFDRERGIHFFIRDISGVVVMDHFQLVKLPRFCFGMISGPRSQIICNDIVVIVLLQYLHVVKNIVVGTKTLHEPGAQIGAIAENLTLHGELERQRSGVENIL